MQWSEFRVHVRHLSSEGLDRVKAAFELGEEAHKGQKRKSGKPYFTHCIAVAHLLADMGADADTIIAALLHDAIEDTLLTLEMIKKEFDSDVPSLIDGVTKLDESELKDNPTLEQETETLRKIFTTMQEDVRIMVIKLADRMHNMQTLEFLDPHRQQSLAAETQDVYVKIADRLSMRDFRDELEALCISILEPDLFRKLIELRKKNEKTNKKNIHKIRTAIHESHPSLTQNVSIKYEPKSWGRLKAQLESEGSTVTGIYALTTVFICNDVETCYRVFGALHERWQRETLSFEDYINSPQINGYQGLHTTVILEDGMRVRCKIRTQEMDKYARRGITTKCFDSEAMGILDYLQWTERIAILSEDTAERSEQFWTSLQSDILGESIIIHGPNDKAIALPKGSSALDGALYLYAGKALAVTSIKINGKEVPFYQTLEHAASIDLTLGSKPTVKREWLEWVQTGFAIATIRSALGQQSDRQKIRIGQQLLRDALKEHKAGFIEEFEQQGFQEGLESLGFASLREAFIALADGHLEPDEIYTAIFEPKKAKNSQQKKLCTVRYSVPVNSPDTHALLAQIHQDFHAHSKQVHYDKQQPKHIASTKVKVRLTPEEQKIYVNKLKNAGAFDIQISQINPLLKYGTFVVLLIVLWGLDPVFASHLLRGPLSAYDLTFIRFVTFFIVASLLFVMQKLFSTRKLKSISPLNPSLVAASFMLLLTALSSYLTLTFIPPLQYILFIAEGIIFTSLLKHIVSRNAQWWRLFLSFCIIAGYIVALVHLQGSSLIGLMFAAISSLSFTLYSHVSSQYQTGTIQARYPMYLFWLSVIALPFAFLFLPYTNILALPRSELLQGVGFVLAFSILPYGLYYECMRGIKPHLLDNALPFVCLSTIIGEVLTSHSLIPLVALPLLLVFLWYFLTMRKEN
ncbi:MAG: HD domain-containing protein [Patescibacteria group bacterium]